MNSGTIRRLFLDYFVAKGHREVPSSSLVPADDPTLLFTNAGMVQFKRVFLGQEQRSYVRAATCQKCVRAGGKHNDLEQVGHTKRHHTFFEMLGNFSFGDYFKREAIAFAWEFVTSPSYLGIDPARLRVTVHHSDSEARALWREISGLPDHRIYGLGDKDNFWQMGDTGPCGPCTEIYVDLEPAGQRQDEEIPQSDFERLAEEGRFLEIWNLVFMQYDRSADGTLTPLPKPSVDTGAGLERIAAVMQGEDDNFHTDIFLPLIERVGELVGRSYDRSSEERASYRVLADHARAVSFLLADGVYPSNEGRGYVLRRILRRAVRHAWLLGRREPTLAQLTRIVVEQMRDVYPELGAKADYIHEVTQTEEQRFLETIEGGLKRLEEIFASGARTIPGAEAFKLYDTFGFPIDLTQIIAGERGVDVDLEGFERALAEQRKRSRDARVTPGTGTVKLEGHAPAVHVTKPGKWRSVKRGKQKFVGYQKTEADTDVLAFRRRGPGSSWCCEKTPSTWSPVVRSATPARFRATAGLSPWTLCARIPRAQSSAARSMRSSSPPSSTLRSMHRAGTISSATTAPPISCTTCCGSVSAITSGSRVHWLSRSAFASTSPITDPSSPACSAPSSPRSTNCCWPTSRL
ncbi:MAG TPA: alanine--tRNA ligase [Gemmatimonadales bacterium]|nr:alanine--tRNA ligase [Gemmatimonadales bacterium]